MENHPIPQDVTGFQFRLIGSMTVKQFAYVGAGAVLAVITFYLPIHILLKLLLIPLFGGTGALFAFVPLEGRPMDVMAGNFFKALFTPNQYLYHKTGGVLSFITDVPQKPTRLVQTSNQSSGTSPANREEKLTSYLSHIQQSGGTSLDQKEASYLQQVLTAHSPLTPAQPTVSTGALPTIEQATPQVVPNVATPQSMNPLITALPPVPMTIAPQDTQSAPGGITPPNSSPIAAAPTASQGLAQASNEKTVQEPMQSQRTTPLGASPFPAQESAHERKVTEILAEKKRLEEELARIKEQTMASIADAAQPVAKPQAQTTTQAKEALAPSVYKAKQPTSGTLPDIPNLLLGTIKDPRGNMLSNILVEVRDTENNPVRAFKTNVLGQFASATALLNGSYTVSFEDPKGQHKFSEISIVVDGSVIEPLEVISIDAREELRKALFA